MIAAEILKMGEEMLKTLHEAGIKTEYYQWLEMYRDYQEMKRAGEKTTYVVAMLSGRYRICERKVYKVLKAMTTQC